MDVILLAEDGHSSEFVAVVTTGASAVSIGLAWLLQYIISIRRARSDQKKTESMNQVEIRKAEIVVDQQEQKADNENLVFIIEQLKKYISDLQATYAKTISDLQDELKSLRKDFTKIHQDYSTKITELERHKHDCEQRVARLEEREKIREQSRKPVAEPETKQ